MDGGWTAQDYMATLPDKVSPTIVGMDRRSLRCPMLSNCIPHRRGDGPAYRGLLACSDSYPPQTWGWTDAANSQEANLHVSPT